MNPARVRTFSQFAAIKLASFELDCYDVAEGFMEELDGYTESCSCHLSRFVVKLQRRKLVAFVCHQPGIIGVKGFVHSQEQGKYMEKKF